MAIYMATRPRGFALVLVPVYIKHSVSCYIYYIYNYPLCHNIAPKMKDELYKAASYVQLCAFKNPYYEDESTRKNSCKTYPLSS